jgi:hypothetical protein
VSSRDKEQQNSLNIGNEPEKTHQHPPLSLPMATHATELPNPFDYLTFLRLLWWLFLVFVLVLLCLLWYSWKKIEIYHGAFFAEITAGCG